MKRNNSNKINIGLKTSIVSEGKSEKAFVNFLKNKLYKSRQPVCNEHSQLISGSLKLDNVKINKINCCKTFYFIDKDNFEELAIKKLKNKINNEEDVLILSIPQMEVCLLAIFEKHSDTDMDKKMLENKLTKHINQNKIFDEKYEHNLQSLEKIMKHLKKIVEDENNEYNLEKFEENLDHYESNELLHTNIIEYIRHLKKEQ